MNNIRVNNFDLIRLFAAFQVVFAHGCHYLNVSGNPIIQYVWQLFVYFPGVPIFFITSGFLISASFERQMNLKIYFWNRFLRIYPALWLGFALAMLMIYMTGYFKQADVTTSSFLFWTLAQNTFVQFFNPDFMRGFGIGVLNGSLWTITVELQFYLLVPILYSFIKQFQHKQDRANFFLCLLIVVFVLINFICNYFIPNAWFLRKLVEVTFLPHFYQFLFGVFLQRNLAKFYPYCANKFFWYFILYFVVCFSLRHHIAVGSNNPNYFIVFLLGLTLISFAFSFKQLSQQLLHDQDISYGIYIYHMLVINVFIYYGWLGSIGYFLMACICTILLAVFSWFMVEKPALRLKKYNFKKMGAKEMPTESAY